MTPSTHGHARGWFTAAAAMALALPAWAAGPSPNKASIEATYQRERAACQAVTAPASRTSCLRDAGAARAEALRGDLGTGQTAEDRARNALARCKVHAPEDQARCERMVRGEGTVTGTVAGGGMIRELVTQEPVRTVPPMSPPMQPVAPPAQQVSPPAQPVSPPVQQISPPVQPVSPPVQRMTPPVQQITPPLQPVQPPPPMTAPAR